MCLLIKKSKYHQIMYQLLLLDISMVIRLGCSMWPKNNQSLLKTMKHHSQHPLGFMKMLSSICLKVLYCVTIVYRLRLVSSVIYIQWRFCFTRVRVWSLHKCSTRPSLFSKALSSICIVRSSVCVGFVSKNSYSQIWSCTYQLGSSLSIPEYIR
jgi:hypothetical protein